MGPVHRTSSDCAATLSRMITLFHDFTSAASAIAVARAHRLASDGLDIELIGFDAIGVDMHVPVTLDVLAELDALAPAAAHEGLILRRPRLLPPTGLAHVIERGLPSDGAQAWRSACYTAFWRDQRDIGDPAVLAAIGGTLRFPADRLGELLSDRLELAAVRRSTADRRRDGVGGVPTILAHRTLVPGLLNEDDMRALAQL